MSHATKLNPADENHLFQLHETFKKTACRTGCSTAAASFLIIGALIVIGSACLCLTLPGVNVVSNVIAPGVLPGSGALLLSTKFIVYSVRKSRKKNAQRHAIIDWNCMLLKFYQVDQMEEKAAVSFIKENLFKPKWSKEYSSKVIGDIKERYPKNKDKQTEEEQALLKALDEARNKILKPRDEERKK
ncbi:MAG: hypothetical protein JJU12_01865 [Chlamydiales bacterium]|nr:hypothetical protein [Chlamydiales bacterium]